MQRLPAVLVFQLVSQLDLKMVEIIGNEVRQFAVLGVRPRLLDGAATKYAKSGVLTFLRWMEK